MSIPRRLCRGIFGLWYGPYARRRIARRSPARLLGRRLLTDPEVLHPVYFGSTRVLIDALLTLDMARKRFLDMGSGSGAIGIFAASQGASVTACDINPRAVALTRDNLRAHQVDAEVFESNLFSALEGRVFDLISFNIPFYTGEPRTPFEAALFGGNNLATVSAFATGCPRFLAPEGAVVVVFSEDADRERILSLFAGADLCLVHERIAYRLFERFHVVRFRRMTLPQRSAARA
jgi:release factor glutamine methyltransferase